MPERDAPHEDEPTRQAAEAQSRKVLSTGFAALIAMALAALATPPLFLS